MRQLWSLKGFALCLVILIHYSFGTITITIICLGEPPNYLALRVSTVKEGVSDIPGNSVN